MNANISTHVKVKQSTDGTCIKSKINTHTKHLIW